MQPMLTPSAELVAACWAACAAAATSGPAAAASWSILRRPAALAAYLRPDMRMRDDGTPVTDEIALMTPDA